MGRHDLVDDERGKGGPERATNAAFLQPIIETWLGSLTRDRRLIPSTKSRPPTC